MKQTYRCTASLHKCCDFRLSPALSSSICKTEEKNVASWH